MTAGENERCGECHGDDLEVDSIRDVRGRSSREPGRERCGPVVARRIDYRCRDCGNLGFVLRRVPSTDRA